MNYMDMMRDQTRDRIALIEDGVEYTYGQLVELAVIMSRDPVIFPEERASGMVHLIRREKILDQLLEFLASCERGEIPVLVPMDAKQLPKIMKNSDTKNCGCIGVMTSGSTGEPKLLFRSYESWADFFPIQNEIFEIHEKSRIFVQGSLAFTGNLNLYMAQFSIGATVVAQNRFHPREWEKIITECQVDAVYLIPSKLMCMPRVMQGSHPEVRTIISGSQSLGREDAKRLKGIFPNAKITLYYGASELSYITYITDENMTVDRDVVGKPFPGVQVDVRDREIYVTTPYHVEGVQCPYTLSDCGYIDERGMLHFIGRNDDIVNIRGRKVSLYRIEEILQRQPEIESAVAVTMPENWRHCRYSEKQHLVLAAFVTLRDHYEIGPALSERLRRDLASYEMPSRFIVTEDIPRRENGKIDKKRLRQIWEAGRGV